MGWLLCGCLFVVWMTRCLAGVTECLSSLEKHRERGEGVMRNTICGFRGVLEAVFVALWFRGPMLLVVVSSLCLLLSLTLSLFLSFHSWTAGHNARFEGMTHDDARKLLGTNIIPGTLREFPVRYVSV